MKRMRIVLAALFVAAFAWMVSVAPVSFATSGATAADVASSPCLKYQEHEYEVCTAYIANSSAFVLVPYYKYGNSGNVALERYVTYRLGSRYYGQAYRVMTNRVASWPIGYYDVTVPDIDIVSVSSSLDTNTATLITRETWTVKDKKENVIYSETSQRHVVTMKRVQSYILHKWVVTSMR